MRPTSHEPTGYSCPFCRLQRNEFNDLNQPTDIIAVTDLAYARISPKWWPGNPGAALVMPRRHIENLYAMLPEDGHAVWDLTQRVAVAMRDAYDCEGTSTTSPQATRTSGTYTSTCSPATPTTACTSATTTPAGSNHPNEPTSPTNYAPP